MKQWENSEFAQKANEIPNFLEDLQYFGDLYEELVKPFLTRSEGSELFRNITFVHGDFHLGNICITDDDTAILYDWQCFGFASNATELSHFVSSSVLADPVTDNELLQAYYHELTSDFGEGIGVEKEDYPYPIFEREMLIRFISYGAIMSTVLYFASPASLEARMGDQRLDLLSLNMYRRIFRILRDPERDTKAFILSGK